MAQLVSSQDFADHIRQLEVEESQLVAATNALGNSLCADPASTMEQPADLKRWSPASLSALADISAEQRTLSDLRQKLDTQGRETQRLHRQMYGDHATYRQQSILANLEIPVVASVDAFDAPAGRLPLNNLGFSPIRQKFLKYSDSDVEKLEEHLTETVRKSQLQKDQFRQTIADLKAQLQDAVCSRDGLQQHKRAEVDSQQAMIGELQRTVEQLERANHVQEQTLLELNGKLSHHQRAQQSSESSVMNLRQFLAERRSIDLGEESGAGPGAEPVMALDTTIFALVRSLERKVWDYETDASRLKEREQQLKAELEAVRNASTDRQNLLLNEHQERFTRNVEDHERQLALLDDRNTISSQQVASLNQQLMNLRLDYDHQLQLKTEHISELETTLLTLRQEWADERDKWRHRRESLELAESQNEKEINALKMTRVESIRKTAILESRFEGMQEAICRLERDVDVEKLHSAQLEAQVGAATGREGRLAEEARGKNELIDLLQRDLDGVKRDCEHQRQIAMATLERSGGEGRVSEAVNTLATQLSAAVERCGAAETAAAAGRAELSRLRGTVDDAERARDVAAAERDALAARAREGGALAAAEAGRMRLQLEEREKAVLGLRAALDEAGGAAGQQAETIGRLSRERDDLLDAVRTHSSEADRLRRCRDDATRTLALRERHARETATDAGRAAAQLDEATADRRRLLAELEESRRDVAALREAVGVGAAGAGARETQLRAQLDKYKQRFKVSQADLNLANETLKTREMMGGNAVMAAGRMQKQVTEKRDIIDSLQSKLRWSDQAIETADKEKMAAEEEYNKLLAGKSKVDRKSEKLAAQIDHLEAEAQEVKVKVKQLEASLERAAVKYASTYARLEGYEQDAARLKLKHQLELKEMERNGQLNRHQVAQSFDMKARSNSQLNPAYKHNAAESYLKASGFGDELRHILGEMRSVLKETRMPRRQSHAESSGKMSAMSNGYQSATNSELEIAANKNEYLAELVERYLHLTNGYADSERTFEEASKENSAELRLMKSPYPSADGSTSPVSGLLASRSDELLPTSDRPPKRTTQKNRASNSELRGRTVKENLRSDTQMLCERLEKKLQNLAAGGGRSEGDGNKELMKLMRNQERKLKKAKVQGSK